MTPKSHSFGLHTAKRIVPREKVDETLVDAAHHEEVQEGVLAHVVHPGGHDEQELEAEVLQTGRLVAHQKPDTVDD